MRILDPFVRLAEHLRRSETARIESVAAGWVARKDGGMTASDRCEFERWLATDPRHAQAWARLNAAWSRFDRPQDCGATGYMLKDLAERATRRRRHRLTWSGVCAVCLLASGLWWQGSKSASMPRPVPDSLVAEQRLPDGSSVELNHEAEIAQEFSPSARRVVLLAGEAHFQVLPDAGRPFVVQAGHVEVRAVGTAFVVRLMPDNVEVVVTEGRVSVDVPEELEAPSRLAEVPAGHRVVVSTGRTQPQVEVNDMTQQDFSERLAWRGSRLEFSGIPLSEAVTQFNTRNRAQLVVGDPYVGQLRISGIFRADNVDGFVRLLEGSFDIGVDHRTDFEIVLIQKP
jgi:transmembrane sensor